MHRLGCGTFRVRFYPWWWIIIVFKWYLVWGWWSLWFSITSCLGCWGWWYGDCLRINPWRWVGNIFPLFPYLGLCFICLKFGFWCVIWPWNIYASFISALSFSVTKGANGAAVDRFFSAMIKYVTAWVDASAEEIHCIVVFSGKNSTVYVIHYALVLEI